MGGEEILPEQECIPVGCVPPAAVAVSQGGLPQCMLGYTPPWLWAWRPPRCGPGDPPGCGPGYPAPRCGPGDPTPRPDPSSSPLGVGLETCKACWDTHAPGDLQGMLGYHLQCMLGMTDMCKNIAFINFVCGQ